MTGEDMSDDLRRDMKENGMKVTTCGEPDCHEGLMGSSLHPCVPVESEENEHTPPGPRQTVDLCWFGCPRE